jgi:alpha-mannosidase
MAIPRRHDFASGRRSAEIAALEIEVKATLTRDDPTVRFEVKVNNNCEDHRLRVSFLTGTSVSNFCSDSAFDVVTREVALPADGHLFRELPVETVPQRSWSAVRGDGRALALVAPGMHEAAVGNKPGRPLHLTLFRGTRRTVLTDGEPGGQCLGTLEFQFLLALGACAESDHTLCKLSAECEAEIRAIHHAATAGHPSSFSLLEVSGGAACSAFRKRNNAWELRLWNPLGAAAETTIALAPEATPGAALVTRRELDGQASGPPEPAQGAKKFQLAPKQVINLAFTSER